MTSATDLPDAKAGAVTLVAHDVGTVGGMERHFAVLAMGLVERGYDVTVIARQCQVDSDRVRWVRVPGPRRPFALSYPVFFVAASWLLRRHRRGFVQTMGAIIFNKVDAIVVPYCHRGARHRSPESYAARASKQTLLYRLNSAVAARMALLAEAYCFRRQIAEYLVAVSPGVARELTQHYPGISESVVVIPLGVDPMRPASHGNEAKPRPSLGVPENAFVALFVGGDWQRKGLAIALQAVARVPGAHLIVVGEGDADRYGRLASELGAHSRIHFAGKRRVVQPYYQAADAFLLPTAYETFSLATYEAAAAGLPLVVSRVSGVEDILIEGENGFFAPRDPVLLASRLQALVRDPELRQQMGRRSQELVSSYTWARMVDRYDQLCRSSLNSRIELSERA